ncbi:fibronectin type III domain-containing protein [Sphingobacterium sp. SGG-5]|uniref:fibronectin type III domain-containing protein n=1 Tax=Sphingobacterium sp. SGG-5 TaxID=2710881 RepID=UPI0013E9FEAD|nr:fibronectin type III domain-containing protein [Sphingobacterium sp. SGG-5]NGM62845.1 fibronectin type III domain-containing protein [Sphingobacterium sp. SGG-5]
MSIKKIARIGFSKIRDKELQVIAKTILDSMTDNSNFPSPIPSLAELKTLLDDYSAKLAVAYKPGSREDKALKRESRRHLEVCLQQLAYYVNSIAKGQASVALSSGIPIRAGRSTLVVPTAVENVRVADGLQSGQIKISFDSQPNIRMYEYRYRKTDSGDGSWSDRVMTSSSRSNIIAGLEAGQMYEFQVRAINSKGPGDWSESVFIIVR